MSRTPVKKSCLDFAFGSPNSLRKPIPHIVFLIENGSEFTRFAVLKLLLNFHINVNPEFTWGFQFVNSDFLSNQMEVFTVEALMKFQEQLQNHKETNLNLSELKKLISIINIQHAWNSGPVVEMQSPIKVERRGPIKLRNYLFIIKPLPKSKCELDEFGGYFNASLYDGLQSILTDFLTENFWSDLIKERIATYWVDPEEPALDSKEVALS